MGMSAYFEDRFFDYRRSITFNKKDRSKKVVLVEIDDKTINDIGVWPLPRQNYAYLVDKLNTFGAKVIVFDVFFSEFSSSCKVQKKEDLPEYLFVKSIKSFISSGNRSLIIPYNLALIKGKNTFKVMPDILYNFMMNSRSSNNINLLEMFVAKDVFPISILSESGANISHISASSDLDGVFRNYQLVANIDQIYLPSVSLSSYEAYVGYKTKLNINASSATLQLTPNDKNQNSKNYKNQNNLLNIDLDGKTKIRWKGQREYFQTASMIDVIKARDDNKKLKSLFNNTIVYLGASAFGTYDLRQTPIGQMTPGVYSHMAMTDMLINKYMFKSQEQSMKATWIMLFLGIILILIVQFFENPIWDLFVTLTMCLSIYFYDTYKLIPLGYENKLFYTLFAFVSCYSWNTLIHFYLANKDKNFLKNAFSSYISPELIDEMYEKGNAPTLGGVAGIKTAYFTDIQGFSSFSEKLSASELVELLNEYLSKMTDILLDKKGTLDKYEGDAIIAFFGAPLPLEDHATRACIAAYRMQEALKELNLKWESEGDKWPDIVHGMKMRIGINTGDIVTGNMGSKTRMNYTMMGDSVNLAARLEEAAKQYGIFTQVSKSTKDAAEDLFVWRQLDIIRVVGKKEGVTTYELISMKDSATDNDLKLASVFNRGRENYNARKWDLALEDFKESLEYEYIRFPELKGIKTNPSEIYIKRCQEFKANPPPQEWDGVYTLTSK